MGSQGPGRKRTPSKNGLTAEEDALNVIAKEAEARMAAKRAARAEAREIRMRELERQQKEIYQVQKKYYGLDNLDNKWGDIEQWMEDSEQYTRVSRRHASVSDDEERMSVGSRSNIRLDLDAAGAYGVLPQASSYHSHKKSKKKKKHSSKTSNGYDDDLSTLSNRSSRLSDESKMSRSSKLDRQSGSVYEDSLYSGSRRSSARASSEYSGFLGSSSRTSSRANSACGSPVEDCSSSVASFMHSSASISGLSRDLDRVVIPDLPNVNGRLSMADDRLERDYLEKGSSRASTISGATLTSLGGTSSRRGSGDTSISADTKASIREIKEIHELKDQIQDVEAKHMQNLKELKDSLLEVEEKYRKAMVSNAQLDNEKTNMMYEVDTLKDSLMELEEMLFETRRELEEKCKDLEREKHAHSILQFQFSELKETLKQSEELLTKHGIVLGPDSATNGETEEEAGKADQNSQTASAEIREGSSVLGTHQLKVCKDQQQKDLDDGVPGNQQFSHAPFSSTNAPLEANENGDLGDQMNQGVEQLENRPEEPPSSVGDDELTATRPKEEIKSEAHIPEDSRGNTVEVECIVHKDGHLETDQQESECVKPSQVIKEETPLESVSGSVHDEPDQPGEAVLDDKLKEEPVESSQTEKLAKTQGASASNKKKKKKKKNKQKQKQSDKQENDTKIDDKTETVCSEDNPNQKTEGDLEGNYQEPLGNDISETTMNTDVPHDAKRTSELDGFKTTNINADDVQDKILLVTDEADLAGISKTISNFDCPESSNGILSDDLSSNVISNPTNIIDEHTEDSTNPDSEAVVFSCELVSSETETSLPHEPSAQSMDAVEGGVESTSCSENIEKSSSVDMKEVKSHLNCEMEEQEENVQNIDLDGTTNPEDQDDSAHPSSSVMEKVGNEAERVIQEQPIDQPMENQLQDGIGAELDLEEVERRDELDKENLKAPTEKVSDTQDSIGAELDQEEFERQDDLDKENLKAPTEKVSDTQDSIGAELNQEEGERQDNLDKENLNMPTEKVSYTRDSVGAELYQEEFERRDELDKENLKAPTEKVSDTQDSIGAELDQEEFERQDDLDKENLKAPTEKVSDTQDSIGAELDQEEFERQDDLDKENLKAPTEKVSDTQDSIGAELDQEEFERQDDLDKENLKAPTEKVSDTQDSIGAELDQEEFERQDDLDKENLKAPTEKVSDTQDSIGAELDQEERERQDNLDKENLNMPTEKVSYTRDSVGGELYQEEFERRDEYDKENLKAPNEKVSDTQDSIGAELDQEEFERQDDLDKENLKAPTEKVSDTQDSIGAELDQEEFERQDDLDKENLKAPTEKVSDTQDSIGAELDQEEFERQDDLDKENLKAPTEKVSDTQDSIGAEVDQEEVERQDELDKENLNMPTENVSDVSHVDNTPLTETQVQVVHEDHLSPNEAIKESVGESDSSEQEPKVEKDEEESSIQNQLEVQLPEDGEDLLVKSDVAAQELKEEDEEEEDEGESFDFDEMDLEASSDAPLKNFLDQPKEEETLFTDEDLIQKEHLELADQESKPKEQKDDGQDTENPQTTTFIEGCLTEDSQISSEVKPNDQQHHTSGNKEDAFEEHQQALENVTLSEGVNLISEMEKRNVGQEINSSIQHENKVSSISGDQEVEKETTERNKEDERKESKKSGKGKGKGKGKEECKMS
ncbi:intracellular protein transport protein USO1-like isoform X7 [Sinocyclocheilus anshuiensis]|uniref:intracellular protein transport protein USO1-like isoform X7 n=1 Tax=Sinocyclocheilus anshuiensis TaxID=1608454 RepID=UPI0007B94458|nr:PREDICTED: intracellular protein transport protein USO1-like isoform X7 [Sinocyclocheilus anshuiensis]